MKGAKGKSPSFQFYVKDWLSDPELQKSHPITRGIWINLLCYMWDAPERGELETSDRELCQLGSCLPEDLEFFFSDIKRQKFCDMSRDCHGNVTLISRRMVRDEKDRLSARYRKKKQRERVGEKDDSSDDVTPVSQECHAKVTPPSPIPTPIPTAKIKRNPGFTGPIFKKYIDACFEKAEKISNLPRDDLKRPFNPFQLLGFLVKNKYHPGAIDQALGQIIEYWTPEDPWAYSMAILKTTNGNWREKDNLRDNNAFKQEIAKIISMPKIQSLLETVGASV